MCQHTNQKPLSEITLEQAFRAYQECSIKARSLKIEDKRLVKDENGYLTLQRFNLQTNEHESAIVFRDGYAYMYGGDSPERFEKNLRLNIMLYMMGFRIHFDTLEDIDPSILDEFGDAILAKKETPS
jgi:hypothetical protein